MSQSLDQIQTQLETLIAPLNKRALPLNASVRFADDLALDSLSVMDFVATIEDEFDITLPLNRLPDLETLGDVALEVAQILKAKA